MIQASIAMTSKLAGDGISNQTVVRAEKKALATLSTYVSF